MAREQEDQLTGAVAEHDSNEVKEDAVQRVLESCQGKEVVEERARDERVSCCIPMRPQAVADLGRTDILQEHLAARTSRRSNSKGISQDK